jgi:hypothetical protein
MKTNRDFAIAALELMLQEAPRFVIPLLQVGHFSGYLDACQQFGVISELERIMYTQKMRSIYPQGVPDGSVPQSVDG